MPRMILAKSKRRLLMIGEKTSDLILGRAASEPENVALAGGTF